MSGETIRIDRGGGDDDLEVRARGQQASHVPQDEVDIEATLVGLVDDESVVSAQHRIRLNLRQEDAVRHELHEGRGTHLVRETHLIAHDLPRVAAHRLAELVRDAVRHGARSQTTRLRVPDHPGDPAPQLHADLGQLRRLTRPGLTRHDDHLVVGQGSGNVVPPGAHGQVREGYQGNRRGPLRQLLRRKGSEWASGGPRGAPAACPGAVCGATCARRARRRRSGTRVRHDAASVVARNRVGPAGTHVGDENGPAGRSSSKRVRGSPRSSPIRSRASASI